MDIYRTVREYRAPSKAGNVLSFSKGERFEILESDRSSNKSWWGVRSLRDDRIGYVPSKYMQYDDQWTGPLLSDTYRMERERNLQRLSDLSIDDQIPAKYTEPPGYFFSYDEYGSKSRHSGELDDLPDPDYDEEGPGDDSNGHVPYTVNFDDWQKMSKQRDAENFDIPEPDYQDEDDADLHGVGVGNGSDVIRPMYLDDAKDPQGLIAPKKLANPCVDSRERQQLHREMFMNQKMGKDVLRQKSELRRELDRRRDTQKKKEQDDFVASKRTSFELKLEEQANKLKQLEEEKMQTVKEEDNTPEFVKMKDRLKKKSGDKS